MKYGNLSAESPRLGRKKEVFTIKKVVKSVLAGFKAIIGDKINKATLAFDLINAILLDFNPPFKKHSCSFVQIFLPLCLR